MMKRVTILFLMLAIVSCGSKPTGENARRRSDAGDEKSWKDFDEPDSKVEASIKSAPPVDYRAKLKSAVESKNNEAIAKFATLALQQNANDVTALEAYGVYYFRKNQYLVAQYFFKRALAGAPNSSTIYNSLGLVALGLKENKDALNFFKKAIELNPKNIAAALNAATLLLTQKNYGKAKAALAAIESSNDPKVLTDLGTAEMGSGLYDEAKSHFKSALKLNAQSKEALLNYATLLVVYRNEPKEASDLLPRLRFMSLNAEMKTRLAELESKVNASNSVSTPNLEK